jgi:hypothetical protein
MMLGIRVLKTQSEQWYSLLFYAKKARATHLKPRPLVRKENYMLPGLDECIPVVDFCL